MAYVESEGNVDKAAERQEVEDGPCPVWGVGTNHVRLQLFLLVYNLGNFLRRLALPKAVRDWSLRSLQLKLIKIGGRVVRP